MMSGGRPRADAGETGYEPFAPRSVVLAADSAAAYTDLLVLDIGGNVVCQAIPILEREGGALVAIPVAFAGSLPGPSHQAEVPACLNDEQEEADGDVRIAVTFIDVSSDDFGRLALAGRGELMSAWGFSADGDLPFTPALVEEAMAWAGAVHEPEAPVVRPLSLGMQAAGGPAETFATADEQELPVGGAGLLLPMRPDAAEADTDDAGAGPVPSGRARGRGRAPAPVGRGAADAPGPVPAARRGTVASVTEDARVLTDRLSRMEALLQAAVAPPTGAAPLLAPQPKAAGVGYGLVPGQRSPMDAATSARERALALLGRHGAPMAPPGLADRGRRVRAAPAGAAALPGPPDPGGADGDVDDLVVKALSGAPGSDTALRVPELQTLQKLVATLAGRRAGGAETGDLDDLFASVDGGEAGDGGPSVRLTKGSESLGRILRNIEKFPELWNAHFDLSVKRTLRCDVTGAPWSLLDYTQRRVHFSPRDEDVEKVIHLLCHLHAVHRMGPDHHQALGAAICQCYKACEQRQRDGDWTLGWVWTGIPDPRPSPLYARTLAHPSEHAAGLAYLKELHALAAHRVALAAGPVVPPGGRGRWQPGGGSGASASATAGSSSSAAAAPPASGTGDAPPTGYRRRRGRGGPGVAAGT